MIRGGVKPREHRQKINKRKAQAGCQLDDPGIEPPERFGRSYTLRPNQDIFLLVNIPMDETKPVSMF
jgi:hypothetical protein